MICKANIGMAVLFLSGIALRAGAFQVAANPAQSPAEASKPSTQPPIKRQIIPLYISERRMLMVLRVGDSLGSVPRAHQQGRVVNKDS